MCRGHSSEFLEQLSQLCRGRVPVDVARGDGEREVLPLLSIMGWLNPVQSQKYQARTERSPLVSVDERVIPAEVEQIGGCHLNAVHEERLAAETRLWSGPGRLEQRDIPYAVQSAEARKRLSVDFADDINREMKAVVRTEGHASFFIVSA